MFVRGVKASARWHRVLVIIARIVTVPSVIERWRKMVRYIIGDTHFGHGNIIEYCNRPFTSAGHMNSELLSRWNRKVGPEDTVIHLGDVRHHPDDVGAISWLDKLNGEILLVRGNHDDGVGQNNMVVENASIQHGRYSFYLEHQPIDVFDGWQIHGHAHNNDLATYPFVHPHHQTVNVSVEVIGYEPLALDRLVHLLDNNHGGYWQTIDDAPDTPSLSTI